MMCDDDDDVVVNIIFSYKLPRGIFTEPSTEPIKKGNVFTHLTTF